MESREVGDTKKQNVIKCQINKTVNNLKLLFSDKDNFKLNHTYLEFQERNETGTRGWLSCLSV